LIGHLSRPIATANQARSNFTAVTATMVVLHHRQTELEAYGEYTKNCEPCGFFFILICFKFDPYGSVFQPFW
jgi:hypothetical protein